MEQKRVLKHLNLTLEAGKRIAVVGLNGAGKTTFIKLLCRLYHVDHGKIPVNGKDINENEITEYRKLLSVVFQDFKLFSLSLKENILLGENGKDNTDMDRLLNISGLKEKVDSLKEGSKVLLYKYFDESGIEPSGSGI